MDLKDLPELAKLIPGALGSLFSMLWVKATPLKKLIMFFGGVAISYYGGEYTVKASGLDLAAARFLLGLFGMSLIASLFEGWAKLDMSVIMRDVIRQVLRLPPIKDPQ